MAAKDRKESLLSLEISFTLFFLLTEKRCFCAHRPAPEEASQWRESLDRVLNNSCKSTLSVSHTYTFLTRKLKLNVLLRFLLLPIFCKRLSFIFLCDICGSRSWSGLEGLLQYTCSSSAPDVSL